MCWQAQVRTARPLCTVTDAQAQAGDTMGGLSQAAASRLFSSDSRHSLLEWLRWQSGATFTVPAAQPSAAVVVLLTPLAVAQCLALQMRCWDSGLPVLGMGSHELRFHPASTPCQLTASNDISRQLSVAESIQHPVLQVVAVRQY